MPTDTLGLPAVFGRYLLLRRLSRGGMGEIFLAKVGEIQGMEKLCIIKKILPQLAEDRGFLHRFVDEAQIAIKLQHANIAPVYEVGQVDGEYFLAMEYVAGRDLRRVLSRAHEKQTRIGADVALHIVREVANGLAYAHRQTDDTGRELGIVHCDVSPPNVLLSFEGEVKLIDFGIAKSRQQLTATDPNIGFGKFGYMAPEQLVRGRRIDRRADLYAVGVILYELLIGDRMLVCGEGEDYRVVARTVAAGKVEPPSRRESTIAPELDELVMRAIAADQGARFQSAEELRDAVQRRLYTLNPTISSDRLAGVVQELFGAEQSEDRQLLAQARAMDLAPFREELHGGKTHTVSFALAAPFDDAGSNLRPKESKTDVVVLRRGARIPVSRLALAAGSLLVLGTLGAVTLRAFRRTPAPVATPGPAAPAAVAKPAPSEAVPTESGVILVLAPPAHPQKRPAAQKSTPAPRHRSGMAQATAPVEPAAPERIEAKYQAVHREYEEFRRAYGPRLEETWNHILNYQTFGQDPDKARRIEAMLEDLRREMARIKRGG